MSSINRKYVIENWLSESRIDLKCANLLYRNKIFSRALYHLQQSNEKLAKGLLISIGFLTPKMARKDLAIKSILGFRPKEPISYGHRILPSLLSDLKKTAPAIEEVIEFIENLTKSWNFENVKPKIAEFKKTIRKSKKGIQKLKKKPSRLIQTVEGLEKEIEYIQTVLEKLDEVIERLNQELDKIDVKKIARLMTLSLQKIGFKVDAQSIPSSQGTKEGTILSIRMSILTSIAVTMASLLDPLEPVTRYPDSQYCPFSENNPYVIHFDGLCRIVFCCLEKAHDSIKVWF